MCIRDSRELGKRRMVGGQEEMIVEVALDMANAREKSAAQ